jgi:hypothetical protein
MKHNGSMRPAFFAMGLALGFLAFMVVAIRGQSNIETRTVHNACSGDCVADVIFLHSQMGNQAAENFYHAWYDTYYEKTGCGDSSWRTDIEFLIEVVAEIVEAPGAPTMHCWQGLVGQGKVCSDQCNQYFIKNDKYAPNVKLGLNQGNPGNIEISIDNQSNLNKLPEYQPNAYSRQFPLRTYLKYGDGESLLVNEQQMPSLSYPNWILQGGLDTCMQQYGAESHRCQILSGFDLPSSTSTSIDFLDGVLYDLTGQTSNENGVNGSFSQDGYIRLLSDGNHITINQGPYAGYSMVKTHNLENGQHTVAVFPWDANAGAVTITNHECNCYFCGCNVTGTRNETDTYVYALQGPPEKKLAGNYTVETVADIAHEKDFSDNKISYQYDASASGQSGDSSGGDSNTGNTQQGRVQDLTPIDLNGPGIFPGGVAPDQIGVLYRLVVPNDINSMFIRLVSTDGADYSLFARRGQLPVPDYPYNNDDYDCWGNSTAEYAGGCPFNDPYPDTYYFFVNPIQAGGAYRLEVEWRTDSQVATQIAEQGGGQDGTDGGGQQLTNFTEIEPNDHSVNANDWDMNSPFTGQLSKSTDHDFVHLRFTESGIYTFSAVDLPPALRLNLFLYSANMVGEETVSAENPGAAVQITFDASRDEEYFLLISGGSMGTLKNQPYRLERTGFIPDPDEPNDGLTTATLWADLSQPHYGYFWDGVKGRMDFYRFSAPDLPGSSLLTVYLDEVDTAVRPQLALLNAHVIQLANVKASQKGQPLSITVDANPGEIFYIWISAPDMRNYSLQPYRLHVETIPDVGEPNDTMNSADVWDLASGPVQGYFWEKATGRQDFYRLIAPQTQAGAPVVFTLQAPPEIRTRMQLYTAHRILKVSADWSAPGQPLRLEQALEAGSEYYLSLESYSNQASDQPYILSAAFTGQTDQSTDETIQSHSATLWGMVYRPSNALLQPLSGASIYAQLAGHFPVMLGTSNNLGLYMGSLLVPEGAEVRVWAELGTTSFQPQDDRWTPTGLLRIHRVVFVASGPDITQQTTTPTPQPTLTRITPTPRPATPTPRPTTPTPRQSTPTSTQTSQQQQSTRTPRSLKTTPTPPSAGAFLSGYVYRLFPGAEPVGVGAAQVILDVNGSQQSSVASMVDRSYQIDLPADLHPGDQLRLRAASAEDHFEPIYYDWKAEAGVTEWKYDFYSYWGTITPPASDDQNRIYGCVTDAQGSPIPGVTLLLQMGLSDALQVLGPTNANGCYDTHVRLPNRIMVTVWINEPGYHPVRMLFFHPYAPENRELNFWQAASK